MDGGVVEQGLVRLDRVGDEAGGVAVILEVDDAEGVEDGEVVGQFAPPDQAGDDEDDDRDDEDRFDHRPGIAEAGPPVPHPRLAQDEGEEGLRHDPESSHGGAEGAARAGRFAFREECRTHATGTAELVTG
ncbi:MAG: hypothetical protein Q27BPR15_14415 [Rhodobacter sp. CACIA14H1]|nr:MAG: hypothetical protein Q27BPR15_14415 [Rhodobacter sp. CACIA14H1]